jgi:putative cysteine peptidase, family C39; bacteriocin-processing endopeptidase
MRVIPGRLGLCICLAALSLGASNCASSAEIDAFGRFTDSMPVRSWSEIRYTGMAKQQFDFSCGAASLVNMLTNYYGVPASELEIIARIGPKSAYSMTDLARIAEDYGFKAVGLALDYEGLMRFRRPLIVYLNYWDDGHFSVLRAIDRHGVWLADPAWGNTRLRRTRFEKFWRTRDDPENPGRVLALLPRAGVKVTINEGFSRVSGDDAGIVPPPSAIE